jgi:ATP-dependent helicase/nuclease subunit A
MAGAGAGKTHNLVSVCLHLLGGATRRPEALPCARLWAVTFTEKAAAEMKERLRGALFSLSRGNQPKEFDLTASFAALDRGEPPTSHWAKVLGALPSANIGTFHGLCSQVLRRYPAEARLDPGFTQVEETEARDLFYRTAETQVIADLDGGGDAAADARACCAAFGLYSFGIYWKGLLDLCADIHEKLGEEGRSVAWLAARVPDALALRASFEEARKAAIPAVEQASGLKWSPSVVEAADACRGIRPVLERLTFDDFERERGAVQQAIGAIKLIADDRTKALLKIAKEALLAVATTHMDATSAELERAFVNVLGRVAAAYAEEKRRRGALDFTDLLVRARDLLRDHPGVRKEVHERVGALLVDEFQDTNALQLDLVSLLCERREGAPRTLPTAARAFDVLPLEPAMLCAVGDRKQSIYDFRGAEVSLFTQLAERLREGDGQVVHLKENRRSLPSLLALFNHLFTRAMVGDADSPFQVAYVAAEDDLTPVREEAPLGGPRAELLVVDAEGEREDRVNREAAAVARRIAAMTSGDGTTVWEQGSWRPARGGDVAILLRRFTHLDAFRHELIARRIPHVVIQGRGFYGAQEVLDLANLLACVDDPSDDIAVAGVLRSPLVSISDASLARLARASDRLTLRPALKPGWRPPPGVPPDDAERLGRFLGFYRQFVDEADRIGTRRVLEQACDALDVIAVYGAGFQGEQRVANIEKLFDIAREHDEVGPGGAGRMARMLRDLAEREPREGQAPIFEEADPTAVRLMTIHQAKGLEFPIVFVPECGAGDNVDHSLALFDRDLGLAVRPRDVGDKLPRGKRYTEVSKRLRDRAAAESMRLFYVAATRARDFLVFSGESKRSGNWRYRIDQCLSEDPDVQELLRRVDGLRPALLPAAREPAQLTLASAPADASPQPLSGEAIVAAAVSPPRPRPKSLVVPVTQIEEFARCPRRYLYRVLIGLEEHPRPIEEKAEAVESGELEARARGTLAHEVLARIDFAAARLDPGLARRALLGLGVEGNTHSVAQILEDVNAFVQSPLGGIVAASPAKRVWRELPFVHALAGDGFTLHLKGTIDLLFIDAEGVAHVVDYKHAHARGRTARDYAFQLDCYSLAVRAFLPSEVPLRSGIVFLRDHDAVPEWRQLDRSELHRFGGSLVGLAQQTLSATASSNWSGHERPICEAMGCGYIYRCHGTSRSRADAYGQPPATLQ